MHTVYIERQEHNSTIFNNEKYQQFPCDMLGMTIENLNWELNILVLLDNGCIVSGMPKSYYDQYGILHNCQKGT